MGKVNHPDTLLSYIKSLEKRIAVLETQQRLSSARISSGQLTVGAVGADTQIEIDATNRQLRFTSPDGPSTIHAPGGAAGIRLEATADTGTEYSTFGTQAFMGNTPDGQSLQTNRVEDGTAYFQATISTGIVVDGSENSAGQVGLDAQHRGLPNSALINLFSDGGVIIYNRGRTTDPPAPGADSVVLYVKGSRLYYRDGTGVVRGPL